MKRILAAVLMLCMTVVAIASCGAGNGSSNEKINVGFMAGPTGMGMAKLIHDNGGVEGNDKYAFTNFASNTEQAMTKLVSGEVDIVCVPTNLAANFYNKNQNIQVLAINCLNSLYVISDKNTDISSFADLEGQTIYTCKSGTPAPILKHALQAVGVNATVSTSYDGKEILQPADVGALVNEGKLPIAVIPEPIITSSLLTIQKNGNTDIEYSVDLDLADAWAEGEDTPIAMGCIVTTTAFATAHKAEIDSFLAEYKTSVEFVGNSANLETASNYIVETEIMAALPAAKKALGNLGDAIAYIDGAQMKSTLESFYTAISITLPAAEFYYE